MPQYQPYMAEFNASNDNFTALLLLLPPDARPLYLTVLITCCLVTIILLTILGNILVLTALCVDFALRSPTHLLMGNLACADLLLGITVLPFSATLEILQGQWPFGQTFCHIWLAIDVLYCTASIYGLMFISIERYVGVTRPLRYPLIITRRRTACAIGIAWLVAMLVSITPFLGWQNQVKSVDRVCLVNDNLSYVLFSGACSFYIPLMIILCVYGRIYREAIRQYRFLIGGEKKVRLKQTVGQECVTLRVHLPQHLAASTSSLGNGHSTPSLNQLNGKRGSTQINSSSSNKLNKFKRERKAAKTLGIVVGMFILCWSPFFLLLPIKAFTSFDSEVIFSICFWLGYCNSCFNPFIYAFSSREFRKAFESILKCHRIQYRPSTSSHRISVAVGQIRVHKSHSCDMTASHAMERSESITSYRTSCDSHHQFIPLTTTTTHRKLLDRPQLSVFRQMSKPALSKSLTAITSASPWHLQEPPLPLR